MWFGKITLNTKVKTARYRMGLSMDQAAPSTDDLYLTFTSLRTRLASTSRESASSLSRATG